MALYVGNKKYCVVKKIGTNNRDLSIDDTVDGISALNHRYIPTDYGADITGFGVVDISVSDSTEIKTVTASGTASVTVTPTNSSDTIHGLKKVVINKVTSSVDANIVPGNIKYGVTILGVTGSFRYILDPVTINPSTTTQTINPVSGHDGYNTIKVNPVTAAIDNNIKATNIKSGVTILGVAGSVIESNETTATFDANGVYSIASPYTGWSEITVSVPLSSKTISPSTATQTITHPTTGGYNTITVNAVTAAIDPDIKPENIKAGVNILGVNGGITLESDKLVTPTTVTTTYTPSGTNIGFEKFTVAGVTAEIDANIIPANILKGKTILGVAGAIDFETKTVNPATTDKTYTPSSGKNGFSSFKVNKVTSSIDANIVAGNIKKNVTILGVTGNYEPVLEEITINPSVTSQTFTADTFDGWSSIKVNAVPSSIDVDIAPENIRQGIDVLGVIGTLVELVGETRTVSITSTSGNTFTPSNGKNAITSIKVNPTNYDRTITPQTVQQSFTVPANYSGHGNITVGAVTSTIDANIVASKIKQGVTILGVTGSCVELVGESRTITSNGTFAPSSGYNAITSLKVDVDTVNNTPLNITPTTVAQTHTLPSTSTYTGYSTVSVSAVTASIDSNIVPAKIKQGVTILGVTGTVVELFGETREEIITDDLEDTHTYTPTTGKNGITSITVDTSVLNNKIRGMICGGLESIKTDVTYIRDYAFYYIPELEEVDLLATQTIGYKAFANTGLNSITIRTNSVCRLVSTDAFIGTEIEGGTGKIYVPSSLVNTYKTSTNWMVYANQIEAISDGGGTVVTHALNIDPSELPTGVQVHVIVDNNIVGTYTSSSSAGKVGDYPETSNIKIRVEESN